MSILRLKRDEVILVAIDFQEKLLPAMAEKEKIESAVETFNPTEEEAEESEEAEE